LLAEHGLSPAEVAGSGRDGRITRNDVLAAAANRSRAAASPPGPSTATAPPASPAAAIDVPRAGPDDDVVEFTKARRATAEHMVRSLATSAHTLVATEVDYHEVDPVRRQAGLSYLPFVARATIDALHEFPHLNASVGDDELIVHRRIHLGIAVDVGFEALVVPVVKDAGGLRMVALAEAMATQADKARHKRLTADDLSGGTFTITNVGAYGTVVTAPVINQPQVAILSTDGVRMRPTAVRSDAGEWVVAVHPLGNLCLSFDHRAVDGAYAAAFLARARELLETRDWQQEL
jgi:2-oxoglutarate dehydrogenase E2 component (dihydrolipoamide succinyltransferase)